MKKSIFFFISIITLVVGLVAFIPQKNSDPFKDDFESLKEVVDDYLYAKSHNGDTNSTKAFVISKSQYILNNYDLDVELSNESMEDRWPINFPPNCSMWCLRRYQECVKDHMDYRGSWVPECIPAYQACIASCAH